MSYDVKIIIRIEPEKFGRSSRAVHMVRKLKLDFPLLTPIPLVITDNKGSKVEQIDDYKLSYNVGDKSFCISFMYRIDGDSISLEEEIEHWKKFGFKEI